MRIVCHHNDRLSVIPIESAEQLKNLIARLPIQIARRLVAEQDYRVGDDGSGDSTRCSWPPESSCGRCPARSASPTNDSAVST